MGFLSTNEIKQRAHPLHRLFIGRQEQTRGADCDSFVLVGGLQEGSYHRLAMGFVIRVVVLLRSHLGQPAKIYRFDIVRIQDIEPGKDRQIGH